MKRGWMLGIVVCMAAFSAEAKTVAWWRFGDLGPQGGAAGAATAFTNLVDAMAFPAVAASFDGWTTGAEAAYMPVTVPLGNATDALYVYDPVTGQSHAPSTALRCPWGGDGSKKSGGAVVAYAPELIGCGEGQSGDFTFECFFRTSEASLARTSKMVCVAKQLSPNLGAWCIMVYGRKLWTRVRVTSAASPDGLSSQGGGNTEVTPDEWHHAALVYSARERTFRLYLDYKVEATVVCAGGTDDEVSRIMAKAGEPIYLGKSMAVNQDRSLAGDMAEARISDAVLAREDFLRFRETGFGGDRLSADPDTSGWFSLDAADLPTTFLGANAKLQDGQSILGLSLVAPEGAAPAASAPGVVTSAVVRAASTKAAGQANAASLACLTNNGRNAYLKVAGWQGLLGGSLTQEFLFRLAHAPVVGQNSNLNSYGLCCSSFLKMLVNQANGTFLCRIKTTTDEKDVSSAAPVAVGVWHHVAFVHDAEAPRTSVYLDGVLLGTHPGRLRMSEGQDYVFAFAQDHANAPQLFDGWIDEIRLTRRALRLDEFLAFNADPGDTLARIRFDGDLSVEPYAYPGAQGRAEGYLEGCPAPAFTAPRAGATATAQEARGESNRHALKLEGGAVVWAGLAPLARDRVTVEFFWRPYEKAAPWPVVLGISTRPDRNVPASMNNAPIPWAFAYEGTWARARLSFMTVVTNDAGGGRVRCEVSASPSFTNDGSHRDDKPLGYGIGGFDGRWHHVAATLETFEEAGAPKTRIRTWWDYAPLDERTCDGRVVWGEENALVIGRNGTGDRLATWDMDEVRITDGLLAPEQFLHVGQQGLTLYFR